MRCQRSRPEQEEALFELVVGLVVIAVFVALMFFAVYVDTHVEPIRPTCTCQEVGK